MAKSKISATAPNGQVFTRTTARAYTHMVVGKLCKADRLAYANGKGWEKLDRDSFRFYSETLARGRSVNTRARPEYSWETQEALDAQAANDVARATKVLAGCTDADEFVARNLAARLADVEATDFDAFHDLGWCGRHDLAVKLRASSAGRYTDIHIVTLGA